MAEQKPIYVKLEAYKEVLGLLHGMKTKVDLAKKTLEEVKKLKKDEDTEIELWENNLSEVEAKLHFIDETLAEPEQR